MKKKTVTFVAVIILLVFGATFILSYLPAFAASNTQQQLQDAQQKKKEQQKVVDQLKKEAQQNKQANSVKKENAVAAKEESDRKLAQIEAQEGDIQNQIASITQDLNIMTTQYDEAVQKAANQEDGMKKRLRAMQENNISSYLEIIFSSESLSDFFVRLDMIKDIMEYDNDILNDLRTISDDLKEKKTAIEAQKTNKEAEELKLAANKQQVENVLQEQKNIMNVLETAEASDQQKIDSAEDKLTQLEQEEARLQAAVLSQVAQQQSKGEYTGSGLIWPVPATHLVTSQFGQRVHPVTGQLKGHGGIDIGAPYGSQVLAAADGRVLFAGYEPGYGYYVTIDHGGIVTLYGHNSKLLVSSGQQVKQGQQVAVSGNSGISTGPHVHFEVIKNGVRQNPLNYVR